jgi:hypothetical protein
MGSRGFRYAPLAVFGLVYLLSCLVGAVLLIVEYAPFVALFEYFSGTEAPELSAAETRTNVLLLVVAPLALTAGYLLGSRLPSRILNVGSRQDSREPVWWLPALTFSVLAAVGLISLIRAGAFGRIGSWLDFGTWVQARSANFERISFFEFVNLYLLLPLAAAWVLVSGRLAAPRRVLFRWVPVPIALALSLFLFSRKAVLTAVLILLFSWAIDAVRARSRHLRGLILCAISFLAASYVALVVVPVYAEASKTAKQAASQADTAGDPVRAARLDEIRDAFGLDNRRKAIVLYAALSPLTRSSAPALYYPVVFPRQHDYFHLDVGQDVLGIGAMPNDNIVVWNYLNPTTPGGTTSVSYQFVLYSQIGTLGAIGASLIIGFLLALAWSLSQLPAGPTSSLLGSMVLLLATYLAIDSLRNSVLVSYGVIWGMLFVATTVLLTRIVASDSFLRMSVSRARAFLSATTTRRPRPRNH